MKKIINNVDAVVDDMLDGLAATNADLARIAGQRILMDAKVQAEKNIVAVLSGGGAGHEPAHAGYVGNGMLAGAISGDVFTSPSVDAVLAGIRAFAGAPGILLIVKNYTGDRLNFGLAMEIARSEGIPVEMVLVRDDVALDVSHSAVGARGLAGTVFVHKVAGAAAAAGKPLAEVAALARAAADDIGTMGIGFSACTVPAAGKPGFTLGERDVELGLGIHGEAGVERREITSSRDMVAGLIDTIVRVRNIKANDRVVLLVNGLGGTPPMELAIAANDALAELRARGIVVERAWSGTLLSALEMAGFSISLMRVSDDRLALLDASTGASAWPRLSGRLPAAPRSLSLEDDRETARPSSNPALEHIIRHVAARIISESQRLNDMDQVVGDGDIGISLRRGAEAVLSELSEYPLADLGQTLVALSNTLRRSLGGSSGPLYAVMLLRSAETLVGRSSLELGQLADAFANGVAALSELGGARPGDRTMVDALVPASDAICDQARSGASAREALASAIDAAQRGTEATAAMTARLGRSTYLGDRALGVADPGAEAVTVWLRAIEEAVREMDEKR